MFKDPEYLTVLQIADILKLTRQTIYRMLEDKEIKAVRVSKRQWRVSKENLEDYLRQQEMTQE